MAEPVERIRAAVVGAGPAGIYMAAALIEEARLVESVDLFDRLPTPFGLLRYGVAPDHLKMKVLAKTLQQTLSHESVRFFGNMTVGYHVDVAQLLADYHAVVYAYGASDDRRLGIPGEDLPGVVGARDFVAWYCDDPDASASTFDLSARRAIVIGLGNVALDAARIMAQNPDELRKTDASDAVLESLSASAVEEIHIVGRRGPQDAKFTSKELRELGELEGVDVIVDSADLIEPEDVTDNAIRRNLEIFKQWSERPLTGARRRITFHFGATPTEVLGQHQAEALRVRVRGGSTAVIPAQLILRSTGYKGAALPGVPFNQETGTIEVVNHRVQRDGRDALGEYANGWAKRGATGVIGTNRSDAAATARAVIEDVPRLRHRSVRPGTALDHAMDNGAQPVELDGWLAIDIREIARGEARGSTRVKLSRWSELLEAASRQ